MKRFRFKMNEKVFPTVLICLKYQEISRQED